MSPLISVIVPIYRVEAYVERCVRSLMEQTLEDVEYIFVDDHSPDESVSILERVLTEYSQRNVRILRHETNKGLPAARNSGLAQATGEYIFHCDSDDFLECDALKEMYEAAKETDADIVYTDWYLNRGASLTFPFEGHARYMRCPNYSTPRAALQGLLHGTMKYNVWNKLIRRSLYVNHEIFFPEGHGMGEDMTMILLFAHAAKVAYLPVATYHYVRQNENSFTAVRSESFYKDLRHNAIWVIAALQGRVPDEDLACFKLNVKYPFLISNRREDYVRWSNWFPEANRYIGHHLVSKRARVLEWCANKNLYLALQAHYFLFRLLQR